MWYRGLKSVYFLPAYLYPGSQQAAMLQSDEIKRKICIVNVTHVIYLWNWQICKQKNLQNLKQVKELVVE